MIRYAVPSGIIVFCLVAFWFSTQFDRVPPILLRGMQPADFPQMVLLLIMALSVLVMIFDQPIEHEPVAPNVWTSMGLFVVFALVAQVDLFLGLGVFAVALAWAWGERRLWGLGLVSLVSPLLIFLLFDQVFKIRFPRGLLTNLWYG
ncbi:tripartite tricarboxylate transporter TctB family protein [Roseobacter sinensis]|uniref:Tripartite tricarboxylate transporter TctB family protein n=1 Tax=Roseobacter sinensis TaxID=2931391 RepID=A0ABT3BE71_9RHOB|nr:tripartite tricarboxylate transporter TctB family protein [Roseobacter sp. WL0113]MCV3271847.1 tripartite tricarboxylate transporter TctB family protein [Roseobacter sp. WL0113]